MARTVQDLETEIHKLAVSDRDRLLRDLVADMDGAAEGGVDAAWMAEAQKRHEELRSGKVKAIPADDVIRKAKARLKRGN